MTYLILLEAGKFSDNASLLLALAICCIIQKEGRDVKSESKRGLEMVFGHSLMLKRTSCMERKGES